MRHEVHHIAAVAGRTRIQCEEAVVVANGRGRPYGQSMLHMRVVPLFAAHVAKQGAHVRGGLGVEGIQQAVCEELGLATAGR